MRKLSLILTIAMLIMAIIIIPVGISNVYLALQLGLIFECVSSIFFLCLFIAFCLFEVREFIREYSWYYEEAPVEGMHDMQDDDVPFYSDEDIVYVKKVDFDRAFGAIVSAEKHEIVRDFAIKDGEE